jgi:hypothetical protein
MDLVEELRIRTDAGNQTRTWQWIVVTCLTSLLPASYTAVRLDLTTSMRWKRALNLVARLMLGLFMPQLVLFAAITDFIRAWIISRRINAAAERCHSLGAPRVVVDLKSGMKELDWLRDFLDGRGPSFGFGLVGTRLFGTLSRWKVVCQRMSRCVLAKQPQRYELVRSNPWLSLLVSTDDSRTTQTDIEHPCVFERWTIAHGFFVVMGGLTIELPPSENDHPLVENQQAVGTASVDTTRIIQLVERQDHKQARFDLFENLTAAQISQVQEATSISVLLFVAKLIYFASMVIRRRVLNYAVAPLEVITTAHVFIALCIMAFWWHKPPYLREGIKLNKQALLDQFPDLAAELQAHRTGKKIEYSYTRPPRFGLRPWHRQDDDSLTCEEANYRALALFPLCFCHAGVSLLPFWGLAFPSDVEEQIWQTTLYYSCGLASLMTILALIDSLVRIMVTYWPWFKTIWTRQSANKSHSNNTLTLRNWINEALYFVVAPALLSIAILLGLSAAAFRDLPDGVYVAGPGDLYRTNHTYGIAWS